MAPNEADEEPAAESEEATEAATNEEEAAATEEGEPAEAGAAAKAEEKAEGPTSAIQSKPTHVPRPRARPEAVTTEAGLHRSMAHTKGPIPHEGFTSGFRLGTQGCLRSLCSKDHLGASPGVRLDGFVGGNIKGWFELGLAGGWGTLGSNVASGTNALSLYGVNPTLLQKAAAAAGSPLSVNLGSLAVTGSKLRTARVGPMFRVHFIPRGRFAVWVGSGVGYTLFRAKYQTKGGDLRFDLHGVDVPVEAGFAVHITKNVALSAQFDYLWSWFGLAHLDHPSQSVTVPVRLLQQVASQQNVDLRHGLPQLWTVGFGIRARI